MKEKVSPTAEADLKGFHLLVGNSIKLKPLNQLKTHLFNKGYYQLDNLLLLQKRT